MRILFTGGGTGGHVFPIIATKQAFQEPYNFYYLGPDGFAKKNLNNLQIKTRFISAGKFRRYFSLKTLLDLIKIFLGIIQSFWHLFLWVPDVIFSKGGYGSFPVVLVGWIYRIPIILHESDSAPGLANRVLAKLAKRIILSFPNSEKYFIKHQRKLVLIGNPVRKEICQGDKIKARQVFKISSDKPIVLIMGGSQGAQKINEIVLNTLPRLLEIAELIHVSGEKKFKRIEKISQEVLASHENLKSSYHLFPFLDKEQMKHALAVADLVANRAGAGSIFELSACAKASILIPLPKSASDHQRKNAYDFAKNGGAIVLGQQNLTPNIFLDEILKLLRNPDKLKEMSEKAKTFYNPNTPELIKREILRIVK
jgi:UDP-N-acetylglucosamine--N-acetylmuramyl-(pentapeptide) pyrophosphoryl-undecaprenol N-acetylglucosamine transferase